MEKVGQPPEPPSGPAKTPPPGRPPRPPEPPQAAVPPAPPSAQPSPPEQIERVVRRLKGVVAVRVTAGERGVVDRVHVLSSADRTVRMVTADVLAAITAELGLRLEPSQVRVALQRPGQQETPPAPSRARPKLIGLSHSTLRGSAEVTVQLEHDRMVYAGTVQGPSGAAHRLDLVGKAALDAVERFLRAKGVFLLEGVSVVPLASFQIALAVVSWLGPEAETLSGSAVVRDDPREATVRAVLDAVNRPLAALTADPRK